MGASVRSFAFIYKHLGIPVSEFTAGLPLQFGLAVWMARILQEARVLLVNGRFSLINLVCLKGVIVSCARILL